ncbi:unnamed protein product [Calypogeia fissa]
MERRWGTLGKVGATQSSVEVQDYACGRDGTRDEGCMYTTLRKTICSLEKDDSGKPVQKCEKTEQLLRKCAGRPAEVVDFKLEATEEDASTSQRALSLDYDSSAGRGYATPFQWQERRFGGLGGDATSEEYPFRGLFERSGPASPEALEELVQGVFGGPFDLPEEAERAEKPPSTAPGYGGLVFGWFKRGPIGGGAQQFSPADASSSDQSQSKQDDAKLYEALSRGVQEV